MKRTYQTFPVKDTHTTKAQMLSWAHRFNICCFMDNHAYPSAHASVECLVGAGAARTFVAGHPFAEHLNHFYHQANDWVFGHFNYEFTPEGDNTQTVEGFPPYFLFIPQTVVQLVGHQLTIGCLGQQQPAGVFDAITSQPPVPPAAWAAVHMQPVLSREQYLQKLTSILHHIHRGDCYELNFCQQFLATQVNANPLTLYHRLAAISPNPFAAFYKVGQQYALCASPERYLKKQGDRLLSQPIKGTSARYPGNARADAASKAALEASAKDRAENVMVVDLVRNDLARVCARGTVQVDELFGLYSFPQVHQMVSTISGRLKAGLGLADILNATFPMGSMTGAPKKRVMELIQQYEPGPRGIYSGTIGYITPAKDFDFNVVIRSLVYNGAQKTLSYHVGSGITSNSNPGQEYHECLVKARAMVAALTPGQALAP